MKLASYLVNGQSHYGVIQPNGDVIDLSTKIGQQYASLLQLIQKMVLRRHARLRPQPHEPIVAKRACNICRCLLSL